VLAPIGGLVRGGTRSLVRTPRAFPYRVFENSVSAYDFIDIRTVWDFPFGVGEDEISVMS
jgi:hypothetical protein